MEKRLLKSKNVFLMSNYIITFLIVFTLNLFTPRFLDDLGDQGMPLLAYLVEKYFTWDGRMVGHFLNNALLALPKIIFDVLNAGMFVLLIWLIYEHALGNRKKDSKHAVWLILFIETMIVLNVPTPGQVFLWETGSIAYLWTMVIMLVVLLPFRKLLDSELPSSWDKKLIYLSILGIFAGNTNENTAGGLIAFEMFTVFNLLKNKRKVPLWVILTCVFSMIGFGIMIVAPGNRVRIATYDYSGLTVSLFANHLVGFLDYLKGYPGWRYILLLLCVCVVLCLQQKEKKTVLVSIQYFVVGLMVAGVMLFLPFYNGYDRSLFGATIFCIIAISGLIVPLLENSMYRGIIKGLVTGFTCLCLLQVMYSGIALVDFYRQETARQNYIQEEVAQGNKNVVIPTIKRNYETTYSPFYGMSDLLEDPTFWANECYSKYFGAESVIAKD